MIVLLSFLLYIPAIWLWRKDNYNASLTLIVLTGLVLRIYCASDPFLHAWDERYHALVAKNLLQHFFISALYEHPVLPFDYKGWTANNIWLHKQPMALWCIALSIKLFGVNTFAVRVPSILFSTIGIIIIYDLAQTFYTKKIAIVSAFLFSIHGLIIDLASGRTDTDHIDICFMFFILLGVWLAVRAFRKNSIVLHILCGVVIGMAVLSKWLPALVVLPLWIMYGIKQKLEYKKLIWPFLAMCFSIIIVALPWQLYIYHAFPIEAKWESNYNIQHFFTPIEGHDGNFLYYLEHLRIQYGEAIYIPVVWFVYRVFTKKKMEDAIIFVWFALPYIFFSVAATKMMAYTLLAAPAIFIITSVGFWDCIEFAKSHKKYKYIFIVVAVSFIILPIRYAVERIKPFALKIEEKACLNDVLVLQKQMTIPEKTIVFNYTNYIELMYYTGCTAYPFAPDSNTIERLKSKGYDVLVTSH